MAKTIHIGWRLRRSNPELGEKVEKFATKLGSLLSFGVLVFAFAGPGPGGYGMTAKCFAVAVSSSGRLDDL